MAGVKLKSFAGVIEPEVALLDCAVEGTDVDRPFAACAYETGAGDGAEAAGKELRSI